MHLPSQPSALLSVLETVPLRVIPEGIGPYPGAVVSGPAGSEALVEVADLGDSALWCAGGEHVCSVREIVRTATGHAVRLPLCSLRLDELAERRARSGHPFAVGETVTLAVSVLRGAAEEIGQHPHGICRGGWWIDDAGKPLFVHDEKGGTVERAAIQAVEALRTALDAADHRTDGILGELLLALDDAGRLALHAPRLESDLFDLGPAQPIGTQVLARRTSPAPPEDERPAAEAGLWRRVADAADAGIAEMATAAIAAVRAHVTGGMRRRRPRASRRGLLWAAAACGAVVVAVGLLWPEDEHPRSAHTADRSSASPGTADSSASPGTADAPSAHPIAETSPTGQDPVEIAETLLAAARACGDDVDCLRPLQEEPSPLDRSGAAFVDPGELQLTLLDDVGGLALLRAADAAGRHAPQIVTLVGRHDEWVLRDVHDAAQHPSDAQAAG